MFCSTMLSPIADRTATVRMFSRFPIFAGGRTWTLGTMNTNCAWAGPSAKSANAKIRKIRFDIRPLTS